MMALAIGLQREGGSRHWLLLGAACLSDTKKERKCLSGANKGESGI